MQQEYLIIPDWLQAIQSRIGVICIITLTHHLYPVRVNVDTWCIKSIEGHVSV